MPLIPSHQEGRVFLQTLSQSPAFSELREICPPASWGNPWPASGWAGLGTQALLLPPLRSQGPLALGDFLYKQALGQPPPQFCR